MDKLIITLLLFICAWTVLVERKIDRLEHRQSEMEKAITFVCK